jgi:tetratricopeptide (TPR) repeat protein
MQRASLYLNAGKINDAQNDLMEVLHFKPDSAKAHYFLARVNGARGNSLGRRQELGEALRLDPRFLEARIELAEELRAAGSPKPALDVLEKFDLPSPQKNTVPWIEEHNWVLASANDTAGFRQGVAAGLAVARTPQLLMQDALLKFDEKNYNGGRASLEEALKQRPQDLRILDALARSYLAQKQVAAALDRVKEQAAKFPNSADMQHFLGSWLEANGKPAEARAAYTAAITINPDSPAAILGLARLDLIEGRPDRARKAVQGLLGSHPNSVGGHLALGDIEAAAHNYGIAIEQYRKVVELDPRNALALNNLAYYLADYANLPDEALKYAQQVKEIAPGATAVDDTIGWAFYRKGVYLTAVKHLEAATADPTGIDKENLARSRYHLAMAYFKVGDRKRGQEMLDATLRLDPSLPEARMAKLVRDETLPRPGSLK